MTEPSGESPRFVASLPPLGRRVLGSLRIAVNIAVVTGCAVDELGGPAPEGTDVAKTYALCLPFVLGIACTTSDTDVDGDGYHVREDCDDSDATVNPAEIETCDGVDNNCSGNESDAVDAGTWHPDADADGFGDPNLTTVACQTPTTHTADATDCDDADATVHPGATEVCENGIDDDCDGAATGCSPPSGSLLGADAKYTGDQPSDYAGCSVSAAGDVNGDGFGDLLIGSFGNQYGNVAGTAYLVLGTATPRSRSLGDVDARYFGETMSELAGWSVSTAGDVDGDGLADMLIGAPRALVGGAAYLVRGTTTPGDLDLAAADARYTAEADDDAGSSVSGAGDVDGDGLADILVGAPYNEDYDGAAYLVFGRATPGDLDLEDAEGKYSGEAGGDYAGSSVSTADDVDGDGFADMLIGAPDNDDGGESAGAAYLVLGGAAPGDLELGSAEAQYTGEASDDQAGWSVSTAGDVDGDGRADMVIGALGNDDGAFGAGAAYVILGRATPGSLSLGNADAQYTGEGANDQAGSSVSTGGDVDADGLGDFLIGADRNDKGGHGAGAAYLVLGTATPASLSLGDAAARYSGEAAHDCAGTDVSAAGDVDGDGFGDLLIGAQYNDDAGSAAGAAYLVLGSGF